MHVVTLAKTRLYATPLLSTAQAAFSREQFGHAMIEDAYQS